MKKKIIMCISGLLLTTCLLIGCMEDGNTESYPKYVYNLRVVGFMSCCEDLWDNTSQVAEYYCIIDDEIYFFRVGNKTMIETGIDLEDYEGNNVTIVYHTTTAKLIDGSVMTTKHVDSIKTGKYLSE